MSFITDLIREHPALSVEEEGLVLAEDCFHIIEEENKELKLRVAILEEQNKNLRTQLSAPQKPKGLEEIEIKIMTLLSKADELTIEEVAMRLQLNKTTAEYYITRMEEGKLLDGNYFDGWPITFCLAQKGREFLLRNNLV